MKRPIFKIFAALLIVFALFFASCGKEEEKIENIPPALSILKRDMKLKKRASPNEKVTFSEEDFLKFFGEEAAGIEISRLPDEKSGALTFRGEMAEKGGKIYKEELGKLAFMPAPDCKTALFGFKPIGKEDDEYICELIFKDGENTPPTAKNLSLSTFGGIDLIKKLPINDADGDETEIEILTYASHGSVEIKDGVLNYLPETDFSGDDEIVFRAVDEYGAASENAEIKITVFENESGIVFDDMAGNEAHLSAYKLCGGGIMTYFSESGKFYFEPEKEVSRIEFLVMAMSEIGEGSAIIASADTVFADDGGLGSGLKGYLALALEKGYIEAGEKFMPLEAINRLDAAKIVSKLLDLPEKVFSGGKTPSSLAAAVSAGIFKDASSPESVLTRAEAAEIICKIGEYIEENGSLTSE